MLVSFRLSHFRSRDMISISCRDHVTPDMFYHVVSWLCARWITYVTCTDVVGGEPISLAVTSSRTPSIIDLNSPAPPTSVISMAKFSAIYGRDIDVANTPSSAPSDQQSPAPAVLLINSGISGLQITYFRSWVITPYFWWPYVIYAKSVICTIV